MISALAILAISQESKSTIKPSVLCMIFYITDYHRGILTLEGFSAGLHM